MIAYILEGPKGSGKSTLATLLKEHYQYNIKHYNGKDYLTTSQLEIDKKSNEIYIHDRGFLSYYTYGFVANIKQDKDFEIKTTGSELKIKVWAPLTQKDFTDWIDACQNQLIILYASDVNILFDRIKKREKESNKGATEDELKLIKDSNQFYYTMGQMLKYLRPNKVQLIDICDNNQLNQLKYELIK